jgi:hypothetical protein
MLLILTLLFQVTKVTVDHMLDSLQRKNSRTTLP